MADRMVHVSRIDPHPDNIRRDLGDVSELADSIRAVGLLQPLIVCVHPWRPGGYQLLEASLELVRDKKVRVADAHAAVAGTRSIGRPAAGRARRKVSVAADHWSSAHRLSLAARARCRKAGHGGRKHGGACGQCWEDVIRADERDRPAEAVAR